jgi:predicted dehydrogenase
MPVSLALIGLKGHQYVVLDALRALPDVRLTAVADDSPEALAGVRELPGASSETRAYPDWRELLANHRPDIVVEAGTDGERADVLTACAGRGIHFIAEKPLAMDLAGLERVRSSVARSGITATMLLTMRLEPPYLAMREAVRAGAVGEIAQCGAQKSYRLGERPAWQKSRKTFSGIIPFIGIHALDLIRWVSGREFAEVYGLSANVAHPEIGEMEDTGCVIARLDNGALAAAHLDYCRPAAAPTHGDDRLRIAGARGVIEAREGKVTLITADEGPRELSLPGPVNLFADFLAAIEERRDPFIPFDDCVTITEVALRARASAQAGSPVSLM